jgi:hypothetical protein
MGYSPRFSRPDRALDEIEAAALAQEALDAARWALAARTDIDQEDESELPPSRVSRRRRPCLPPGPSVSSRSSIC